MKTLRTIIAIIVGYLLFAVTSMLLVSPVMSRQGPITVVLAFMCLALIGGASGWVAAMISGGTARLASSILAGIVAVATLANLLMKLGAEPVWYKVATLVLTVPAILLAGRWRSD